MPAGSAPGSGGLHTQVGDMCVQPSRTISRPSGFPYYLAGSGPAVFSPLFFPSLPIISHPHLYGALRMDA